jgi:hypothetical protein
MVFFSMKIEIPFIKSEKDNECGQRVLQMVLAHFGEEHSIEEVGKLERTLPSGLTWTAGIAVAAKKLGFPVKMISTTNFSHNDDEIEFYKKNSNDEGQRVLFELIEESKVLRVEIIERDMSIEELENLLSNDSIPIVLVNWFCLAEQEGYHGHFLVLSGFDEEYIYVHNPGIASAQAFLPIKKESFVKAWEYKGTDKDVVLVGRK